MRAWSTDPFKGVEFWNKALNHTKGSENLRKFLVGARTDVSGLTVSQERLQDFMERLGFEKTFKTSSATGKGVKQLLSQVMPSLHVIRPFRHLPPLDPWTNTKTLRKIHVS